MMKRGLVGLVCLICLCAFSAAQANSSWEFSPRAGIKYVTGETSYDIGGRFAGEPSSWRSKLEFDLDATLLDLGMDITYNDIFVNLVDQVVFSFDYYTSIATDAGTFRDRDWYYNVAGNEQSSLWGDTKSGVESDLKMSDLKARAYFLPLDEAASFRLFATVGYLYQKWGTFAAKSFSGSYFGDPTVWASDASALTYEVTYEIPYAGVGFEWLFFENFTLKANVDFSPVAEASDRDDHVLRTKLSKGSCDGDYLSAGAEVDWAFASSWTAAVNFSYMMIDTDGDQIQYFYGDGGPVVSGIDNKIESEQTYVGMSIAYKF